MIDEEAEVQEWGRRVFERLRPRPSCFDPEFLGDYIGGHLSLDEADAVAAHVQACEPCADILRALQAMDKAEGDQTLLSEPFRRRLYTLLRKASVGTIVSFMNLKGGVGKTTMAVNIAAYLADLYDLRVLLIDLDPQTNSTVHLVPQDVWEAQDRAGQTLAQLFRDKIEGKRVFDLDKAILRGVADLPRLDLLPSSLGLVEIQDELITMPTKTWLNPIDVLGTSLTDEARAGYDYILIDCPPNLGLLTLNGTIISDFFVIPTVPDILSKYGIQEIFNRVDKLKRERHAKIEYAGMIFCKVRPNLLHRRTMAELRATYGRVFETVIHDRAILSMAPEENRPFLAAHEVMRRPDWAEVNDVLMACTAEFIAHTRPERGGSG